MEEDLKCIYHIQFLGSVSNGYVGQTKDLNARLKQHQKDNSGCRYLKHAISFYKFDNAIIAILEDNLSTDEANMLETLYIKELDTLVPNGYNLNEGGNCAPMIQETKDLLASGVISRWQDPEWREKQLAILRTEEYREKHRINTKKMWEDPVFRQNYYDKIKIYWENEANIEAARDRTKKVWEDPARRKNQSAKMKIFWAVYEHRQIQSTKMNIICNTPEMIAIRIQNGIQNWEDPEYRAKQMNTRGSEEFSNKMSISLQEHNEKKSIIRQEKSLKCREVFVRHDGDTQKIVDELKVSKYTIADWMKPYCDDEEIIRIKKQRRKDLSNTPEAKERLRRANKASHEAKARAKLVS